MDVKYHVIGTMSTNTNQIDVSRQEAALIPMSAAVMKSD